MNVSVSGTGQRYPAPDCLPLRRDVKTLREDNQMGYQLVATETVLFVQNPRTADLYTSPMSRG